MQGNSTYFMTVEIDRRGRCGLAETLVESGYEVAQHFKNKTKIKKQFFTLSVGNLFHFMTSVFSLVFIDRGIPKCFRQSAAPSPIDIHHR